MALEGWSRNENVHLLLLGGCVLRLDVGTGEPALVHASLVLVHPFVMEDLGAVGDLFTQDRREGVALPQLLELGLARLVDLGRVQQLVHVVRYVGDPLHGKRIGGLVRLSPLLDCFPDFQGGDTRDPGRLRRRRGLGGCRRWIPLQLGQRAHGLSRTWRWVPRFPPRRGARHFYGCLWLVEREIIDLRCSFDFQRLEVGRRTVLCCLRQSAVCSLLLRLMAQGRCWHDHDLGGLTSDLPVPVTWLPWKSTELGHQFWPDLLRLRQAADRPHGYCPGCRSDDMGVISFQLA